MDDLMVGAARVSIDPTPEMFPMPTGFGIVSKKYNSVHVRALALSSGGETALMLVFELSDMPTAEGLTSEVSEATGIPERNIIVTWTHNHTSPRDFNTSNYGRAPDAPEIAAKRNEYKEIEINAAVEAGTKAVGAMKHARVAYGTTESYINVNRDYESLGGYWVEAVNFAGYSDKTLALLKFVGDDGKVIAVLMNHGTHNVFAMEENDTDGEKKMSSNFSGIACEFVEQYYGDGCVAIWTAGCAGDQNPIFAHGMQYEYPDGYTASVRYPDGASYMMMEYTGRIHGADALRVLNRLEAFEENTAISHGERTLMLPAQRRRKTPDGRWINPRMGGSGLRDWGKNPYGEIPAIPDMDTVCEPDPEHPVEMVVHMLKIGDIALIFTNGEMFSGLGARIKEESPYDKTIVVTYSVAPSTSYIVDRPSDHHRVFQAFGAVAPGMSDDIILNGIKEMC